MVLISIGRLERFNIDCDYIDTEGTPMKVLTRMLITAVLFSAFSSIAMAQSSDDYHPFLSDKFHLGVGVFWPKINFDVRVDGSDPEEEIDFDEALNLSDYQAALSLNFRWRFGEKWSVVGQYWSIDRSGEEVLTEDVSWGDITFKEGTFVGGGVGLDIAGVFFGREFNLAPQHDLGWGIGAHYMNLDSFLEGEIIADDDSVEFQQVTATAAFPLPNIGAWYMYSWSPKWMFGGHLNWLSASIGDYSGGLWDAQVGVNYQAFKNIGFGLSYKAFIMNVDVDTDDWHGKAELDQIGPMLTVTAMW
jgi:hypothetical protein